MAFLTSDEAHELFTKTLGAAAFLQTRAVSAHRERFAKHLERVAKKSRDPRLSTLATSVRLDAFTDVKEKIQQMVDKLVAEKEDEIKHKDFCIDEFNKNSATTEELTRNKEKLEAQIADHTQSVADLTAAINQLNQEITDLNTNLKRAGEDREIANKDFNEVMKDQMATEKLLTASLNILKGFYEKAALVQVSAKQPAFKEFKKNENSGGLMSMMQGIIADSKAMQAEALRAEEDAQLAYESFVKNSNDSLEEKGKDLINKEEMKAKAEQDLSEATTQHDGVVASLEQAASELHDLHIDCDYLMKNFDLRTTARDEEVEALKQGIAFFSGASFTAFLQSW